MLPDAFPNQFTQRCVQTYKCDKGAKKGGMRQTVLFTWVRVPRKITSIPKGGIGYYGVHDMMGCKVLILNRVKVIYKTTYVIS